MDSYEMYVEKFDQLLTEIKKLGADNSNQILKCLIVYKLGVHLETIFAEDNTAQSLKEKVYNEIDTLKRFVSSGLLLNSIPDINLKENKFKIEDI